MGMGDWYGDGYIEVCMEAGHTGPVMGVGLVIGMRMGWAWDESVVGICYRHAWELA